MIVGNIDKSKNKIIIVNQPERIIQLVFNRAHFEEIFLANRQGNIFLSPEVKSYFIWFVIFLALTISAITYSLITDKNAGMIVLLSFFTLVIFILYFFGVLRVLELRSSLKKYLEENDKFASHSLVLTENVISLMQDKNEHIIKWSELDEVRIKEDHVIIKGSLYLIIPKKDMLLEDYEFLLETIRLNMKGQS